MSTKRGFSKKIVKLLAEKPAISVSELVERVHPDGGEKTPVVAISRSIKGLRDAGLIEEAHSGREVYARLTKEGKKKAHSIALERETALASTTWDGKWRVILLDLPESRKDEREGLRYLLKKAGFVCVKNSVWISPFPYEYLFTNIKKDFGLTTELMIFVTSDIDKDTEKAFFEMMK